MRKITQREYNSLSRKMPTNCENCFEKKGN